jgi:hypothetical protein
MSASPPRADVPSLGNKTALIPIVRFGHKVGPAAGCQPPTHLPTRQQKAPVNDEGFSFRLTSRSGLVIASALVVAVPPVGTACG